MKAVEKQNDLTDARLWKSLDSIVDRLGGIETKLTEVVRLEEKVKNHEEALSRYGNRLDSHDRRIHDSELFQAKQGDRASVERLITNVQEDVNTLRNSIREFESTGQRNAGQKDVGKEILKYLLLFVSAILVYKITRG